MILQIYLLLKNNRSAASGVLGRDNGYEYFNYLKFVPLGFKYADSKTSLSRLEELSIIDDAIGGISNYQKLESFVLNETGSDYDAIVNLSEKYSLYNEGLRTDKNYMIDGLVIEINESAIRDSLGWDGDKPNYSTALKFDYLTKETKVKDIEFYIGKTNRITPVVVFEPIEFFGNIQQKVSLANYKRFKELEIAKGDTILVEYRNDVLSHVQKVVKKSKNQPFEFLKQCPLCGTNITISKQKH